MNLPSPDTLDEFINALQLCLKSEIHSHHVNQIDNFVSIHFIKIPDAKDDEQWSYFEKLVSGVWHSLSPQPLIGYFIQNASQVITATLINFLFLTRLKKENMMKLAELDPKYKPFIKKIFGVLSESRPFVLEVPNQAAEVIFKRLQELKMTLRQLSHETGLSMVAISNFKSGKDIRLSNLLKIIKALGLTINID